MMLAVIAAVACAVLGVVYFGLRFWLVSTRPADIRDVPTPTLDRLNRRALEHMAAESVDEDEAETAALADEEAPAALKAVVPPEPPADAAHRS
jgi:hypothetical protein